jgi:predicted metal-dependent hydrolase
MFIAIINKSNKSHENKFPKLSYYLNRHIELDGDEHGHLSLEKISELCGDNENKWNEVLEVSKEALKKRIGLWNEITEEIRQRKPAYNIA